MFTNKKCFENLKGKKVILVNSLLENKDINIFAKEAGISIYFTIQPLNDRIVNPVLNYLLYKFHFNILSILILFLIFIYI